MTKPKEYKLRFRPTPIKRLLVRPKLPFRMVGYPTAHNWDRYWRLNYEQAMVEKRAAALRAAGGFEGLQDGVF